MTNKAILLTSAATFLFATQVIAADLTNPFYVPSQGQLVSTTTGGYYRTKGENKSIAEGYYLAENLEYGITDSFSINGTLANLFDTGKDYNNDHNFTYQVGAKYNTSCNNILFQASASYLTLDRQDFYGSEAYGNWYKEISGEISLGYNLGNGLTPYISYELSTMIDHSDRTLEQSSKIGIHKYSGKYALDLGLRYDFETEGSNKNDLSLEAATDYYLKDNVALGIYGAYYLDGSSSRAIDYAYDAGIRLKVAF
jgi:hypothetical protein